MLCPTPPEYGPPAFANGGVVSAGVFTVSHPLNARVEVVPVRQAWVVPPTRPVAATSKVSTRSDRRSPLTSVSALAVFGALLGPNRTLLSTTLVAWKVTLERIATSTVAPE